LQQTISSSNETCTFITEDPDVGRQLLSHPWGHIFVAIQEDISL